MHPQTLAELTLVAYTELLTRILTTVVVPNGVGSIAYCAFAYCTSLISVTLPTSVTNIGSQAFDGCKSLISVTIPNSVTTIGTYAFIDCTSLISVTIPKSVTNRWSNMFSGCSNLTEIAVDELNPVYNSVDGVLFNKSKTTLFEYPGGKAGTYTIPNTVTNLADRSFENCTKLTSVTIPANVIVVGGLLGGPNQIGAFYGCTNLTRAYFQGNAPNSDSFGKIYGHPFNIGSTTVYYLPGTTGWGPTLGVHPTVLWNPQVQTRDTTFGVRTNKFGFSIAGNSNLVVVVDACTNLANAIWVPLQTNTLSGDALYFSDPQWTNYSGRFYRLRWP